MSNMNEFLLYKNAAGHVKVEVFIKDETIWLTQKTIAELFDVGIPAVAKHIANIYSDNELKEESTVSKMEIVQMEGKRNVKRLVNYYNLDLIIAVGYRVNSVQATHFRIWATKTLKEYIIKGFVLDDDRLKQAKQSFGKDYFDELIERIQEIRSSERRFYQKVTDIYALSADYNKYAEETKVFFASVQNKLHWAITGKTAAEIVYTEADASKIYMGLKTWKHSPEGKIMKSDVSIAKNYLNEKHITELNRIVSAYLDLAENNAQRGIVMKMKDWSEFLENFLKLSNYPILKDKGKISALEAKIKAETEFEKYRVIQDKTFESDFDIEIKKLKNKK